MSSEPLRRTGYTFRFREVFNLETRETSALVLSLASMSNDLFHIQQLMKSVAAEDVRKDSFSLAPAVMNYYSRLALGHLHEGASYVRDHLADLRRLGLKAADELAGEFETDTELRRLADYTVAFVRNFTFHYGYIPPDHPGTVRHFDGALTRMAAYDGAVVYEGDDLGRFVFADAFNGEPDSLRLGLGDDRHTRLILDGIDKLGSLTGMVVTEYILGRIGSMEEISEPVDEGRYTLAAVPTGLSALAMKLTGCKGPSEAVAAAIRMLANRMRQFE